MKYPKGPCKECKKRHMGCHNKCKPYNDWKIELKAYNDKIKQVRELDRVMNDTDVQRSLKFKKMGGRK